MTAAPFQPSLYLAAPPRGQMPKLHDIAHEWEQEFPHADPGEPCCFACGWMVPLPRPTFEWWDSGVPAHVGDDEKECQRRWQFAQRFLDRAHLVDHMYDGLAGPDNLIPLCKFCHERMPSFKVGERADALRWVREQAQGDYVYQLVTDEWSWRYPDAVRAISGPSARTHLRRLYIALLEARMARAAAQAAAKAGGNGHG